MSTVLRTINASVNIPKPTVSASFDSQVESFLSKAIATGDTDRIHGVIRGFDLYPNTATENTFDIVPAGTSTAVLRKSNTEFLYVEIERTYTVTLNGDEFPEGAVAFIALVPDFDLRKISFVLYSTAEFNEIPEGSVLLGGVLSFPGEILNGWNMVYAGGFAEGEMDPVAFKRDVYDPTQNTVRRYEENFVNVSANTWVTTAGSASVSTDPQVMGSGRVLSVTHNTEEAFAIQFPHLLTPFYDFRDGVLVNATNKVRAIIQYSTSGEFSLADFNLYFRTREDNDREIILQPPFVVTSYPSTNTLYAEYTPDVDDQEFDRNYRLRIAGTFTGELFIHSVIFEVDLDPSGTFTEKVIELPSESGGGGSGITVIEDGGTISGSYQGDVICAGDVNIVNDVIVDGNLFTNRGICYNTGYAISVRGNWFSRDVQFTIADTPTQGDIDIHGDWFFQNVTIECENNMSRIVVSGDLIGDNHDDDSTNFNINGLDGQNGGRMIVYGDMRIYHLQANGGISTVDLDAGNGGDITIMGNVYCRDLILRGGSSSFTDRHAGNGGAVEVRGDILGDDIFANGGDSVNGGRAGSGGIVDVDGDVYMDDFDLYGGICTSDSHLYGAGLGGTIFIGGDAELGQINIYGGERIGTLTEAGNQNPSHGGSVSVQGDAFIDYLDNSGGDVSTVNFVPHNAGDSGSLYVGGNLVVGDLISEGGNSTGGQAGNGNLFLVTDGDVSVQNFLGNGGDCANGIPGNGAGWLIRKNLYVESYEADGGAALADNGAYGGLGGSLNVEGTIHATGPIYLEGGACLSDINGARGGGGGNLTAYAVISNNGIYLNAGDHSNNALIPRDSAEGTANGGSLTTIGDFVAQNLYSEGGSSLTGAPATNGGSGGTVTIGANCQVTNFLSVNGGDAQGSTAGPGGSATIFGSISCNEVLAEGGDATDSPNGGGGDAGAAGSGGNLTLVNGGTLISVSLSDGVGSIPATANSYFTVSGNVSVRLAAIANRAGGQLRPSDSRLAVLRVGSFTNKQLLTSNTGVDTGNVSALGSDSLFLSTNDGGWLYVQGVAIP